MAPKNDSSETSFTYSSRCRATGGLSATRSGIATWNLRGQRLETIADQLVYKAIKHDIGAVCLSETYGGPKETKVSIRDHSGDLWQLLGTTVAAGPVNSRGCGFLISPRFEVISFEQFSHRVSLVKL